MIIGIVAIARNLAIGREGKLPWHYSTDLKFFKQTTSNNAVVMGFNTWKAIGKPLPNRLNIVISRSNLIEQNSEVLVVRGIDQVIALSRYVACDLFIIGGSQTYLSFADVIDKWIVTEIPETIEDADAFMPNGFLNAFQLIGTLELQEDLIVKKYEKLPDM